MQMHSNQRSQFCMWRDGGCPSPHVILWMRYEVSSMVMLNLRWGHEVWGYVKPKKWGNEVSSMVLSNFRSLHAALSSPDLSLRGPPLLVICWLFRETMCFSIRIKYSTIRSCKRWLRWQDYHYVFLMFGQNSWWWTSNNCDNGFSPWNDYYTGVMI